MKRVIAAAIVAMLVMGMSAANPAAAETRDEPPAGMSSDGVAPIIVLLDASGSMAEDDGSGTIKLNGAKAAIRDIVGGLSSTTVFGVWSYPGGSDCYGGGYVSAPAPLADRLTVLRNVDAIAADSGTPTGVALRSLADDLTERGYNAATIVLVSDGESTCGPPPCDVANELVDEGFDVTVPTVGFRTSEKGAAELSCVAEATGAATYSAADSAELAEKLDGLVRAQLELTVTYDAQPMAGSSTRITATVTHVGGEDARDIRLALTFSDSGNPEARRAAIPPVVRLGNVPRGKAVEHSWVVGTGSRETSVTTRFTMSAWGTNAARVLSEGEYTTGTPKYTKDELGPLFGQVSTENPLIIFGDSFSSGEGVGGKYDETPAGVSYDCHRNQKTYLGAVFGSGEKKIVACSGAVMNALYWTSQRAQISQIQEMNSHGYVPGAGILTFGGNDLKFEEVVKKCVLGDCSGADYLLPKLREANALPSDLTTAYKQAWAAMNRPELREKRDGRYVPLFVLPYPLLTHDWTRGDCHWPQFTQNELITAGTLNTVLNDNIELAVESARRDGFEVYYVADVEEAVRPDHTLCEWSDKAYINGVMPNLADLDAFSRPESVHPKESGYLAETDAIIRWSRSAKAMKPTVSDAKIAELLEEIRPNVQIMPQPPVRFDPQKQLEPLTVSRGGTISPQGGEYEPGTSATFTLHSKPRVIGSLTADADGVLSGTLLIPLDAEVGQHELVVTGFSPDGNFTETRIPVSIIEPTPLWVWAALASAILTFIGGAVLVLLGLKRRKLARLT